MASIQAFAYPLLAIHDNGTLPVVGSCVVMAVAGERFLLSAAHVFRNLREQLALLRLDDAGYPVQLIPLEGMLILTSTRSGVIEPPDLALMRLESACAAAAETLHAITVEQIDTQAYPSDTRVSVRELTSYCIVGFPAAMNKPIMRVGKKRHAMVSYWSYCDADDYKKENIDPLTHLAISMRRNAASDDGRFIVMRKPHGMSGGPIWRVRFSPDRTVLSAKLVGIGTEYREKTEIVVATRIWVALNLMRKSFPDVGAALPKQTEPNVFRRALAVS